MLIIQLSLFAAAILAIAVLLYSFSSQPAERDLRTTPLLLQPSGARLVFLFFLHPLSISSLYSCYNCKWKCGLLSSSSSQWLQSILRTTTLAAAAAASIHHPLLYSSYSKPASHPSQSAACTHGPKYVSSSKSSSNKIASFAKRLLFYEGDPSS